MTGRLALLLTAAVFGALMLPVEAYLKIGVDFGGVRRAARWPSQPVSYFVADRGIPRVSASELQRVVDRAFDSWEAIPTSAVGFSFAGFTTANPSESDGMSTIGFLNRPDLDRVLGVTEFLINLRTAEILEADIFFNSQFPWSTAEAGESGVFDLESIALHEIGHFLGLGHSAIGETEPRPGGGRRVLAAGAVMFPIAFQAGNIDFRSPQPDDAAGASDLYPAEGFRRQTGTLGGRVTKGGSGVAGAHVVAFSLESGQLVGNFTFDESGSFTIAGLEPGAHLVRVEPLDDADVESFFGDEPGIDIDFRVTYLERLVVVPRGGSVDGLEIRVEPK